MWQLVLPVNHKMSFSLISHEINCSPKNSHNNQKVTILDYRCTALYLSKFPDPRRRDRCPAQTPRQSYTSASIRCRRPRWLVRRGRSRCRGSRSALCLDRARDSEGVIWKLLQVLVTVQGGPSGQMVVMGWFWFWLFHLLAGSAWAE